MVGHVDDQRVAIVHLGIDLGQPLRESGHSTRVSPNPVYLHTLEVNLGTQRPIHAEPFDQPLAGQRFVIENRHVRRRVYSVAGKDCDLRPIDIAGIQDFEKLTNVFNVGQIVSRSGPSPVNERNPDRRIVA